MPFARRIFAISAASIEASKSMVATTCERCSGTSTNGVATYEAAAQS